MVLVICHDCIPGGGIHPNEYTHVLLAFKYHLQGIETIIRITFAGWTFIGAMKYLKNAKRKKQETCLDTLPETNIAPKNGWLEYYFPIGFRPIFRGKLAVSFRELLDFLFITSLSIFFWVLSPLIPKLKGNPCW